MPKSEKQRKAACAALNSPKPKGAAKNMKDSMKKKDLKKFCTGKLEESTIMDTHILTDFQKKELIKVIDTLVEERVRERQADFIKKYTKFIVESATNKVYGKMKEKLLLQVEEKINDVKSKAEKACRSVVLEASSKVSETKKAHKILIEEFKKTAPKLVKDLADKKVKELAEESLGAIEENNRLTEAFKKFSESLAKAGYVINEDIDNAIEKERNEKRMLRTKLVEARRENKLNQLTEGMLPGQKKKVFEMLEDCVTEKQVEDKFLSVKAKILAEERHVVVEDKNELREKEGEIQKIFNEEKNFDNFLALSREFIKKS